MKKEIRHAWFFPHPAETIWKYLTDSELLSQWLMKNDFKPVVGHEFRFTAGPVPAIEFDGIVHCKVLEISAYKKISYSWKFGPAPGVTIIDSLVVWTLTPKDGGTELLLVHSGFADLRTIPAYDAMNTGWQTNVNKILALIATKEKNDTTRQTSYHASIMIPGSAQHATDAISRVSSWWTENTTGNSKYAGDEFLVPFGETFSRFKVTEYIPGKKIRWFVLDCNLHWMKNKKEWKDTEILWEISSSGDTTRIDMTHIGLLPGIECFEDCNKGWNHYVKKSLYKLLIEGRGEPDHKDHSARDRQ